MKGNSVSTTATVVISASLGLLGVVVYRLFFHPLAKVPGPLLAKVSGLYEFYYQCVKGAQYAFRIEEMHKEYGPIIRINPNEVHINDGEYFDQLYNVSNRLDKDQWYYSFIGSSEAGFGTSRADLHQARRKAMSRFFAPSAVSRLETSVRSNVMKLCQRLEQFRKDKAPVNLSNAFRCLSADTVTVYSMPHGSHFLDSIDFADEYNAQSKSISYIAVFHRHIPIILPIFMAMPRWLVKMVSPPGALQAFDFQNNLKVQAYEVANSEERSDQTVLQGIMNSDLPRSENDGERLTQEARTLVGAGTETTGLTLDHIVFGVLSDPQIYRRLKAELKTAVSQGIDITLNHSLRNLPYLNAVVNEGLRLSFSVSGRLPRVDPRKPHVYKEYILPPGTVMSMSLRLMHTDPSVFKDPLHFDPDRWLDLSTDEQKLLDRNFVPFSRGSRSCIGRDLAMLTVYMAVANLFYRFDAELFETDESDLAMAYDLFSPFAKDDSNGLRARIL